MDTDNDGSITEAEALAAGVDADTIAHFKSFDDGDGKLNEAEFDAAVAGMAQITQPTWEESL